MLTLQVVIGTTDITEYVVEGTYKMDGKDTYQSWLDGNMVEHRIIVNSKVEGSFDVVLSNKNNMPLDDFYEIFANAENLGVVNALVYVTNKGIKKAISAYYELTSKEHRLLADGSFLDVVTVGIKER